jgi:hypothetical protein
VRSQFAFNVARGGCSIRKVQRYLRASGLDAPAFVTEAARQRHIHPRHKRQQLVAAPPPIAVTTKLVNPFALLGKKPDALPAR